MREAPERADVNGKKGSVELSGSTTMLGQHIKLLTMAEWHREDLAGAITEELQPTFEQLREHAAQVSKMTSQTPVEQFTAAVTSLVRRSAIVEGLLPPDDPHRFRLADKVTDAFLEIAIRHVNHDEHWSYWLLVIDAL